MIEEFGYLFARTGIAIEASLTAPEYLLLGALIMGRTILASLSPVALLRASVAGLLCSA